MTDELKQWSIREAHPEVRNTALAAAKRDGVTIGGWLNKATPPAPKKRVIEQHQVNQLETNIPPIILHFLQLALMPKKPLLESG
ncbi:hypothetical protein [Acetobacter sp. LMG 32666]|uniref:hypothetical protein n=1 Tax=Acetobacter sp. LMG 32666 TaxID=2959295 RepID=UPI0030C84ED4